MTYNGISTFCQNLLRPSVLKWIAFSLAGAIVWQVIAGAVSILSLSKSLTSQANAAITPKRPHNESIANLGLTMPFFGKYVPDNLNDMDIKQSMLNLKVVGIMLASTAANSQVIIHTANGRDQTYRVGDTLPGNVVIKRITSKGVLVERKGELESLSFPENELIFELPARPLEEDKIHAF